MGKSLKHVVIATIRLKMINNLKEYAQEYSDINFELGIKHKIVVKDKEILVFVQGTELFSWSDWIRNINVTPVFPYLCGLYLSIAVFGIYNNYLWLNIGLFGSFILSFIVIDFVDLFPLRESFFVLSPVRYSKNLFLRVHNGFSLYARKIQFDLCKLRLDKSKKVVIIGHSQGGGIGQALYHLLKEEGYSRVKCIFFAPAPYVVYSYKALPFIKCFFEDFNYSYEMLKEEFKKDVSSIYFKGDAIRFAFNNIHDDMGRLLKLDKNGALEECEKKEITGKLSFIKYIILFVIFMYILSYKYKDYSKVFNNTEQVLSDLLVLVPVFLFFLQIGKNSVMNKHLLKNYISKIK